MTESSTSDPEKRKPSPLRILRDLPKFRNIWLSKSISSTGSGIGRIALVLMVAPSGATAVALVLAGTALPMLLGPLAGAVADRVDQRRLLAPGRRPTRRDTHGRARRPAAFWLIGGVITGGAGAVLSGLAPDIAVSCVGQVIGGIGNTADLVGTDMLIQRHVPQEMLGRAYGIVYGGDQLALIGSSVIAAPLVALAGARVAFVIAGAGVLASLPIFLPILRRNPEPGSLLAEAAL